MGNIVYSSNKSMRCLQHALVVVSAEVVGLGQQQERSTPHRILQGGLSDPQLEVSKAPATCTAPSLSLRVASVSRRRRRRVPPPPPRQAASWEAYTLGGKPSSLLGQER